MRSRHYTGAAVSFGIALAYTIFVIFMVAVTGFTSLLGFLVVAVILLIVGAIKVSAVASDSAVYEGTNAPAEAIRITPEGMLLGIEGTPQPVFVPWGSTPGFTFRYSYGAPALVLHTVPGVTPPMPAPAKDRVGPVYQLQTLDQPIEAIDHAMRHFSSGRAGVLR